MPERHESVSRERSDVSGRAIAWMLIAVAGLVFLTLGGLRLLTNFFAAREARQKAAAPPLVAAERERLSGVPADEELRQRAGGQPVLEGIPPEHPTHRVGPWHEATAQSQAEAERALLESYGWVDREKGIVRVPLQRAREIALDQRDKYLPARPKP